MEEEKARETATRGEEEKLGSSIFLPAILEYIIDVIIVGLEGRGKVSWAVQCDVTVTVTIIAALWDGSRIGLIR